MKKISFIFIFLAFSFQIFAQEDRARTQFQEYSTGVGSFIQGIPVKKQPMQGDMFVYENFPSAVIVTKTNHLIENVQLRYNAFDQKVEVQTEDLIKALDGRKIKYFYLEEYPSEKFINISEISSKLPHDQGFVKIIAQDGNNQLLKRYYVTITKANYNIALSTGNKYDTAHLKEEFYITDKEKFILFSGSKKDIKKNWSEYSKVLLKYVKKENLKFKEDADFQKFFNYLAYLDLI